MADRADRPTREAEWISRVMVSDDHQAFEELVRLHQSAVRRFLRRLTDNDQARADDLGQETFWRAYRYINTFKGRGRFLSWLFGIAYQRFISDERRAGRVSHVPLLDDVEDPEPERISARLTFDQLMQSLRPAERAAVMMHYRHELTHAEIAEALGVPVGTVKSLIRRARLKLQHAHAPHQGG